MQADKVKQVEFWKDFGEFEFMSSLSPGKASASFPAQSHIYIILSLLSSRSPFNDLWSSFDFHHSWWSVSKLSLSGSPKTSVLRKQRAHFCPHDSFCDIHFVSSVLQPHLNTSSVSAGIRKGSLFFFCLFFLVVISHYLAPRPICC